MSGPSNDRPQIQVTVDALRPGDYLPATKRTILRTERGLHTLSGHTEVSWRRNSGREGMTQWRSSTTVWIVRPEDTR